MFPCMKECRQASAENSCRISSWLVSGQMKSKWHPIPQANCCVGHWQELWYSLSLSVFLVRGLVFFFLCLSLSLTRQEGAPPQGTPVCWRYAKNYPHSPSDIPRGCLTTSAVVMTVDLALACVASTFAMQPSSAALETQKQYGNIMNTCKLYSAHWSVCEAVGQLIL